MSLYDYESSERISRECYPFYALIMAAMRQADNENLTKLRRAFPETYYELNARYVSPGGLLEEEQSGDIYAR